METQDIVTVGVVGLILYLVLKPKAKVETFPPYVPTEVVTSTIKYGETIPPAGPFGDRYPGYRYNPSTGDYVDLATGEHLMVD